MISSAVRIIYSPSLLLNLPLSLRLALALLVHELDGNYLERSSPFSSPLHLLRQRTDDILTTLQGTFYHTSRLSDFSPSLAEGGSTWTSRHNIWARHLNTCLIPLSSLQNVPILPLVLAHFKNTDSNDRYQPREISGTRYTRKKAC